MHNIILMADKRLRAKTALWSTLWTHFLHSHEHDQTELKPNYAACYCSAVCLHWWEISGAAPIKRGAPKKLPNSGNFMATYQRRCPRNRTTDGKIFFNREVSPTTYSSRIWWTLTHERLRTKTSFWPTVTVIVSVFTLRINRILLCLDHTADKTTLSRLVGAGGVNLVGDSRRQFSVVLSMETEQFCPCLVCGVNEFGELVLPRFPNMTSH